MMKEEPVQPAETAAAAEPSVPSSPADVPEASPEGNEHPSADEKKPANTTNPRRRYALLIGGIVLIVVAVLCITLALTLGRDGNDKKATQYSVGADSQRQETYLKTLPLFGSDVTEGYQSLDELQKALAVAIEREASAFVAQQSQNQPYYYREDMDEESAEDGAAMPPAAMPESENMMMDSSAAAGGNDAASTGATDGVTDFQTNNQEDSVDEADRIKADENFVYAAYDDHILIWDIAGNLKAQVDMPPIDLPDNWGQPPTYEDEGVDTPAAESSTAAKSMVAPDYMWEPKPYIQSMLLTDNHLIVVVSGYNDYYNWGMPQVDTSEMRVINGYKASQVRVYEKVSTGGLNFVGKKDVNGHYVDARSIGNNVYLGTAASIDYWTHLWTPIDRFNFPRNWTTEEYMEEAMSIATNKLIPDLTEKLSQELQLDNGDLTNMMKINQWMTSTSDADEPGFNIPFGQYDVVSNIAQVTSFDVTAPLVNDELDTSASTYMAPAWFDTLYGTEDHLVMATRGWNWDAQDKESAQTTYLVALAIDGASTSFVSVGTIDGHLLNSYALDIVGQELRAATTVERNMWWWGRPIPFMDDMVAVDVAEAASPAQAGDPDEENPDPKGLCPLPEDDECVNDENYDVCISLVREGCVAINTMESCPLQFDCALFEVVEDVFPTEPEPLPRPPESEESRTENYMTVLNLVSGNQGLMSEKGRVQIGLKHERITSVRFFDNVAYAVTFERTDPFYVLDMSVPKVLGELKLPGFSSYLHSMNPPENSLILAVGQNATSDGRATGLMVTVFDATDPTEPKILQNHVFEDNDNAHSNSNVEWDYKAFRYVAGKLVIPLNIYYYQEWDPTTQQMLPLPEGAENFNGFAVLNVNTNEITEQFRVSHSKEQGSCSCGGYLPTRSFVYSGDLMTVQDSVVVSSDLDTGAEVWRLQITVDGVENNQCCW